MNGSFLEALLAQDTPCAKFSCRNRSKCAEDVLACDAWGYYVKTGFAVHPMLVIPDRVSRRNQPKMGETIVATREKFLAADSCEASQ